MNNSIRHIGIILAIATSFGCSTGGQDRSRPFEGRCTMLQQAIVPGERVMIRCAIVNTSSCPVTVSTSHMFDRFSWIERPSFVSTNAAGVRLRTMRAGTASTSHRNCPARSTNGNYAWPRTTLAPAGILVYTNTFRIPDDAPLSTTSILYKASFRSLNPGFDKAVNAWTGTVHCTPCVINIDRSKDANN